MKIKKGRNKLMVLLAIINSLLTIGIFTLGISGQLNNIYYFIINVFIQIGYIILILYMIGILQFINEPISVQTPFSLFLGLVVISFLDSVISILKQNQTMLP